MRKITLKIKKFFVKTSAIIVILSSVVLVFSAPEMASAQSSNPDFNLVQPGSGVGIGGQGTNGTLRSDNTGTALKAPPNAAATFGAGAATGAVTCAASGLLGGIGAGVLGAASGAIGSAVSGLFGGGTSGATAVPNVSAVGTTAVSPDFSLAQMPGTTVGALAAPAGGAEALGSSLGSSAAEGAGSLASGAGSLAGGLGSLGSSLGGALSIAGLAGSVSVADTVVRANTSAIAGYTGASLKKETYSDCIFNNIAKMALKAITASVVSWAANGFQGNPSFVQDPARFFIDVADQEIGRFLSNSEEYKWMCSPFRLQIQRALIFNRSFAERSQCTLSGVVNNFNDFIGSTNNTLGQVGGWTAWNTITSVPQNNPYGAYALANVQLEAQITGAKEVNLLKLNWGKGFFSWPDPACTAEVAQNISDDAIRREDIDSGYDVSPAPVGYRKTSYSECKDLTPGSVIAEQVNKALGSPQDQLVSADEVNEVISALLQGLVVRVLGGEGLAGVGSSLGGDSYNYSAQLLAEDQQFFTQNKADIIKQAQDRIDVENYYIRVKNQTLPRIPPSVSLVQSLISCYSGSASSTIATALFTENDVAAASSTVDSILSYSTQINRDIAIGEINIRNLQRVIDALNTLPYERRDQLPSIMQQFNSIFGDLHSEIDAANAEYDRDYAIPNTLNEVDLATSQRISDCRERRNLPAGGN